MVMMPKKAKTAVVAATVLRLAIFIVDLRGNVLYKSGLSVSFSGFKLVKSKNVLSILDVYHLSHIPQALTFHYYSIITEFTYVNFTDLQLV